MRLRRGEYVVGRRTRSETRARARGPERPANFTCDSGFYRGTPLRYPRCVSTHPRYPPNPTPPRCFFTVTGSSSCQLRQSWMIKDCLYRAAEGRTSWKKESGKLVRRSNACIITRELCWKVTSGSTTAIANNGTQVPIHSNISYKGRLRTGKWAKVKASDFKTGRGF